MSFLKEREFVYFIDDARSKATMHLPEKPSCCGDDHGWKPRLYYGERNGRQLFVDLPDLKPILGLTRPDKTVSLDRWSQAYRPTSGGLRVERKDDPKGVASSVEFSLDEYATLCDIVRKY